MYWDKIETGRVRQVIALALGPERETLILVGPVRPAVVGKWAVERHVDRPLRVRDGRCVHYARGANHVRQVSVIQRLTDPAIERELVVRLVSRERDHDEQVGGAIVTHDERHVVAISGGRRHDPQVEAGRPARRGSNGPRCRPRAGDRTESGVETRRRLTRAAQPRARHDVPRARAGIPTEPVDVYRERLFLIDRQVKVDRFADPYARLRRESLDLSDVVGRRAGVMRADPPRR